MKCHICGKGMPEGMTLHRINELGVIGVWACWEHMTEEQRKDIDPEQLRLIRVIEGKDHEPPQLHP